MTKARVPKGEKYWCIDKYGSIQKYLECGSSLNDYHYESLMYFYTEEEARAMRDKLRAVLKGADVIEMPKEKDSVFEMKKQNLVLLAEFGWQCCYNWFKSKIVK